MSTTPTTTRPRRTAHHPALRTLVATGVIAAGAVTLTALPAAAQDAPADEPALVTDRCVPERFLDEARARILRGIDARLHRLDRLDSTAALADSLTESHRTTIEERLASTRTGLTELRTTVEGETDGCALADEGRSVVEDFRVYVVLTPQTRLTIGADRVVAAEEQLDAIEAKLDAAIAAAEAAGEDVTEARADFATYQTEADAALATAAPIGDTVLGLVPHDWPEPADETLDTGRTDLRSSIEHLRAARAAAAEVRDDLT